MGQSVSIPDMRMEARVVSFLLVFLVPYVLSSEVGVHFCCEDGKDLFYSSRESILQLGTIMSAKCVPSRDRKHRESLEERFLMTIDPSRTEGEDGRHVRRKINNIGDWNLDCTMGAIKTFLDLGNEGLEPAPHSGDSKLRYQTGSLWVRELQWDGECYPQWEEHM